MNRLTVWFIAGVAALILASVPALFGELPDMRAEYVTADELSAMQAEEGVEARKQAAGQALCTQARGPNSEARWTPEGHLVCRVRNKFVRSGT
jgi:hypothetical protein